MSDAELRRKSPNLETPLSMHTAIYNQLERRNMDLSLKNAELMEALRISNNSLTSLQESLRLHPDILPKQHNSADTTKLDPDYLSAMMEQFDVFRRDMNIFFQRHYDNAEEITEDLTKMYMNSDVIRDKYALEKARVAFAKQTEEVSRMNHVLAQKDLELTEKGLLLEKLSLELHNAQASILKSVAECGTMQSQLQDSNSAVANLTAVIQTKDAEISMLRSRVNEALEAQFTLESDLSATELRVQHLLQQKELCDNKISELSSALQNLTCTFSQLKDAYEQMLHSTATGVEADSENQGGGCHAHDNIELLAKLHDRINSLQDKIRTLEIENDVQEYNSSRALRERDAAIESLKIYIDKIEKKVISQKYARNACTSERPPRSLLKPASANVLVSSSTSPHSSLALEAQEASLCQEPNEEPSYQFESDIIEFATSKIARLETHLEEKEISLSTLQNQIMIGKKILAEIALELQDFRPRIPDENDGIFSDAKDDLEAISLTELAISVHTELHDTLSKNTVSVSETDEAEQLKAELERIRLENLSLEKKLESAFYSDRPSAENRRGGEAKRQARKISDLQAEASSLTHKNIELQEENTMLATELEQRNLRMNKLAGNVETLGIDNQRLKQELTHLRTTLSSEHSVVTVTALDLNNYLSSKDSIAQGKIVIFLMYYKSIVRKLSDELTVLSNSIVMCRQAYDAVQADNESLRAAIEEFHRSPTGESMHSDNSQAISVERSKPSCEEYLHTGRTSGSVEHSYSEHSSGTGPSNVQSREYTSAAGHSSEGISDLQSDSALQPLDPTSLNFDSNMAPHDESPDGPHQPEGAHNLLFDDTNEKAFHIEEPIPKDYSTVGMNSQENSLVF